MVELHLVLFGARQQWLDDYQRLRLAVTYPERLREEDVAIVAFAWFMQIINSNWLPFPSFFGINSI